MRESFRRIKSTVYNPKRCPLYNFLRALYVSFLVLGIILLTLLLVLVIAIAVAIRMVQNDPKITDEDKFNGIALLNLAIVLSSIGLITGVMKQVISWLVIQRTSGFALILCVLYDISLAGMFVAFYATEHTGAVFFSVLVSFCFLDILILTYVYANDKAHIKKVRNVIV